MENKTVADEILQDFETLLDEYILQEHERKCLANSLKEILEKRLGKTCALYYPEKLARDMANDTTFGWVGDEPHHPTCACGECLDRAADEKG